MFLIVSEEHHRISLFVCLSSFLEIMAREAYCWNRGTEVIVGTYRYDGNQGHSEPTVTPDHIIAALTLDTNVAFVIPSA